MPFTPSHMAAALPFVRTPLIPSAIAIGTMAPDVPYFVPLGVARASVDAARRHGRPRVRGRGHPDAPRVGLVHARRLADGCVAGTHRAGRSASGLQMAATRQHRRRTHGSGGLDRGVDAAHAPDPRTSV